VATKSKYAGVTQFKSGWQYRIKMKINGKPIDTTIKYDSDGNPFMKARDAHEARLAHIEQLRAKPIETASEPSVTLLSDVYENYMQTEANSKAAATLRKQDSMWRNHVEPQFGDRDINSITIVELDKFLYDVYQTHAYGYVEGFLKFFYLLFGHAYRMEVIDVYRYRRMFVDRGTRLQMPKQTQEDYEEDLKGAVVYTDEELRKIENIFKSEDGNLYIAFLLGLYCGLRISECFGLRWSNVDLSAQTITIDRQMQYVNGEIRLCPVKTLTGVRTVLIPNFLYSELCLYEDLQNDKKQKMGNAYRNTERVYDEVKKEWIVGGDFVNRKKNGELLTTNSMKYWSRKIKSETGIDFKYHCLRHTFATRAAAANVPLFKLMALLGHKKVDTTKKYYINIDDEYVVKHTRDLIGKMYDYRDNIAGIKFIIE
jgi:integrase